MSLPANSALQIFGPVIGNWHTTGTHGLIPDVELHGTASFEWHESGGFIRMESGIREQVGIPAGVAIIASDDQLGSYLMSYFDERGVSRFYQLSMQDRVMRWWRDAPGFLQRYSLTISEDSRRMVGRGELCRDGSIWEKDLELTYTRADS